MGKSLSHPSRLGGPSGVLSKSLAVTVAKCLYAYHQCKILQLTYLFSFQRCWLSLAEVSVGLWVNVTRTLSCLEPQGPHIVLSTSILHFLHCLYFPFFFPQRRNRTVKVRYYNPFLWPLYSQLSFNSIVGTRRLIQECSPIPLPPLGMLIPISLHFHPYLCQ